VGVTRRDPMAMKPFAGYNFGDYWKHWLSFDGRSDKLPAIFHVNWFRQDRNGRFLWPGFGDNLRVLRWIIDRCAGRIGARETPIGYLPNPGDLDLKGADVPAENLEALLSVEPGSWREEMQSVKAYLEEYGDRLPRELLEEHGNVVRALG
jgi:phosphoenolpyruvate carboxykinase (GTP)